MLTVNRIVVYRLSQADIDKIEAMKTAFPIIYASNVGRVGDAVPAIVVKPHSDTNFNGQAFIDGNFTLWLTSVQQGDKPGEWQYPETVKKPK